MKIVVGISGASGAPYARRLLQHLRACSDKPEVSLVLSRSAQEVYRLECAADPAEFGLPIYSGRDYSAPFASGSSAADAMVIVPASMSSVARIAHGISDDLLTRAADVMLKERRRLILVPRETPYSTIHLENLLRLSQAGALVMPASPSFYGQPRSIDEVLDTVLCRILDHLGIANHLTKRWQGELERPLDHGEHL